MTVHVYPIDDMIEHHIDCSASDCDCLCEPTIEYVDKETGLPRDEPIVIHNAIDGRK